ncbi:MAG: hypothetical protein NTW74_14000 [Acidobacteria bacterium]|nr:hypothetical protein [Acidobacteriota bacterium]
MKLFRQKHTLSKESRESDFLVIHTKEWDLLSWVLYSILAVKIYPVILDSAVVSPFFLAFSRDLNTFEETPIHRAILALRDQIRRFNESNTPETLSVLFEYSPKQRGGSAATIKVEFRKVANLLHLCDRWLNIIELCIALHRYLDGKPFHQPTLSTKSPIEGLGEEIEAETGTFEEILNFINAEVSQ